MQQILPAFRISWGDAGGWAQAIGNFGLWVLALSTLVADRKRIRVLERDAASHREELEKEQARLVSAWADEWTPATVVGQCRNGSAEPIYQVIVRASSTVEANPPDPNDRRCTSVLLMRPSEQLSYTVTASIIQSPTEVVLVDISFRDAAGRNWWRRSDGLLSRL